MAIYQLEAKLGGELLDSVAQELVTPVLRARFFDSDDPNTPRVPDPATLLFEIDPENTQGKKSEYILAQSHSTVGGVTTLVNVQRGGNRDATLPFTSDINLASSWDAGSPIGSATQHYNDNEIRAYFDGTIPIPGNVTIDGDLTVLGDTSLQDLTVDDTINFIDNTVTVRRDGAGDLLFKDNSTAEVSLNTLAAAAGVDQQVRVSVTDTTSGFLNDKLTLGNGLTKTINNPGGNEDLELNLDLDPTGGLGFNGTQLAIVSLAVPTSTEAAASNSSIFENTDDLNRLSFKDSGGVVEDIVVKSDFVAESGEDSINNSSSGVFNVSGNIDLPMGSFDGSEVYQITYNVSMFVGIDENPGTQFVSSPTVIQKTLIFDGSAGPFAGYRCTRSNEIDDTFYGTPFISSDQAGINKTAASFIPEAGPVDVATTRFAVGLGSTTNATVDPPIFNGTDLRFAWNHSGNTGSDIGRLTLEISAIVIRLTR